MGRWKAQVILMYTCTYTHVSLQRSDQNVLYMYMETDTRYDINVHAHCVVAHCVVAL